MRVGKDGEISGFLFTSGARLSCLSCRQFSASSWRQLSRVVSSISYAIAGLAQVARVEWEPAVLLTQCLSTFSGGVR